MSAHTRFWAKVKKGRKCWLWTGAKDSYGYGNFKVASYTSVKAPRFAYEEAYGPIPAGRHVCHHCDTPACVRPKHLYAGTREENMADRVRRKRSRNGNTGKTHCLRGHPLSGENLYVHPDGHRTCRTCQRAAARNYDRRRRHPQAP